MKPLTSLLAGAALALSVGAFATAKIVALDLEGMVAVTDDAVYGTIVDKFVQRIDHPIDGPELYFTTLIIQGRSLETGAETQVDVTFPGGFIDPEHGAWNSEAPSPEDTRVGARVVAFYRWADNLGGDLAANALYASHGGIFQTFEGGQGVIVQGRGEGYAVAQNVPLVQLDDAVSELAQPKRK